MKIPWPEYLDPPPQTFVLEIINKKFYYVSKKCSDIYKTNCFLTRLFYFIGHSYMFHCMSGIEGGGQDTVAWVS